LNLECVVGSVKRVSKASFFGGLVLGVCYFGFLEGTERYLRSLDEPVLLSDVQVKVERLPDGRIHIYEKYESHRYVVHEALKGIPFDQVRGGPDFSGLSGE